MKSTIFRGLSAFFATAFFAGCGMWDPDPEPKPFTISGTLTLVSGDKAQGATVQLKQNGEAKGGKVTAGEDGAYSLSVPIGEGYSLEMEYAGYTDTIPIGSIPPRDWKPEKGGAITKNNTLIDTSKVDVYAAGTTFISSKNIATYWKNGAPTVIGGAGQNSTANAILVNGTDVYVAGSQHDGTRNNAVYWKNRTAVILSNQASAAEAWGITIDNGVVYVCGQYGNGTKAVYWKDDGSGPQEIELTYGTGARRTPRSITVAGSDVYVAGRTASNTPGYWKVSSLPGGGGGFTPFSETGSLALVWGIEVVGGVVHAAGSNNEKAYYWKHDGVSVEETELPGGKEARSLIISNNDIYIAGFSDNQAMYWKNGEKTVLAGTSSMEAYAIFVSGHIICCVGKYGGVPAWWLNDKPPTGLPFQGDTGTVKAATLVFK